MEAEFHLTGDRGRRLISLLSDDHTIADATGRHRILLGGYGYRWYRVGVLDYILQRSDE